MIRVALAQMARTLFTAIFTEKFLINVFLLLAEWLARRTETDVDDKIVAQLREALGKSRGQPTRNLYKEIGGK